MCTSSIFRAVPVLQLRVRKFQQQHKATGKVDKSDVKEGVCMDNTDCPVGNGPCAHNSSPTRLHAAIKLSPNKQAAEERETNKSSEDNSYLNEGVSSPNGPEY